MPWTQAFPQSVEILFLLSELSTVPKVQRLTREQRPGKHQFGNCKFWLEKSQFTGLAVPGSKT